MKEEEEEEEEEKEGNVGICNTIYSFSLSLSLSLSHCVCVTTMCCKDWCVLNSKRGKVSKLGVCVKRYMRTNKLILLIYCHPTMRLLLNCIPRRAYFCTQIPHYEESAVRKANDKVPTLYL